MHDFRGFLGFLGRGLSQTRPAWSNRAMGVARGLTFDALDDAGTQSVGGGGFTGPVTRVHILENEFEAHVLLGALEEERVDAVVQHYREMAFDGLFIPQRGWGAILTRVEDSKRAIEIIGDTLRSLRLDPPQSGDGGDPD